MGVMKELIKSYITANSMLDWHEGEIEDLQDLNSVMFSKFTRLIEICFEADIEIKDLIAWAEEARREDAERRAEAKRKIEEAKKESVIA